MVIAEKKQLLIASKLLLISLVAFPFGQLIKITFPVAGQHFGVLGIDLVSSIILAIYLLLPEKTKYEKNLFVTISIIFGFSLILSHVFYSSLNILVGAMYGIRFISYTAVVFLTRKTVMKSVISKDLLLHGLTIAIIISALFGWLQYLLFPDMRFLKNFGWDDHYFRLIGTFLDPGFSGILFTLGAILNLHLWFRYGKKDFLVGSIFLVISTIFTYSRASYLALIIALAFYLFMKKEIKLFIAIAATISLLVPLLPRPESEGVKLERVTSINTRINNYQQTAFLFLKSPVFGHGYNLLCAAREKNIAIESEKSHSCSGSDASLLFILSTIGLVGFLALYYQFFNLYLQLKYLKHLVSASFIAVFVHSFFNNTLFYPFILFWFAILIGVGIRSKKLI